VLRILLVESHPPTREFINRALSEAGFEVAGAADPHGAYELFASSRPDAVVLGANLAGGEAAALAQRLRASNPRVLLVVTDQEHLGKARGLQALLPLKANAYVADPTKRELVEKVQQLLAQQASPRARLRGTALVLSRAPAARGELKSGVVPRLMHQIWRSIGEGVLVLDGASLARRVFFLRGAPVAAQSDDPAESLLRWLQNAGRLDAAAKDAALEAMAGGLSPGAALIAAGVLEPGEPLQATLRDHLRAMVLGVVGAKEGRWRFHSGAEFTSEVQGVELLPLQVILEGARAGIPIKHFADALKAVTEAYPVRTGDFQQILPAAGLGSADLRLALALNGRVTTSEFLRARPTDLKEALSIVWFLSMIGAVAFHETAEPDDPAYGKALPRTKRPLPADRAEAVRQAALRILPGTYFHALGLDVAADGDEVERAYHEVASRFHPDGFAEYEVGDLADLLSAVQDKVSAAYRVLSNVEKRRSYLSFLLLRFELTGARHPGIDVDAEIALKRGERALREHRIGEAVSALREAVERSPKEPEYGAMLAFALILDRSLPREERASEARRLARKSLAQAPENARAAAVVALAEEALGDLAEARRVILEALKAQPEREILKAVLYRINRARG
jgi:CheY-like chemotaxis protein/tetratricopeptide (TPR) repeat protein